MWREGAGGEFVGAEVLGFGRGKLYFYGLLRRLGGVQWLVISVLSQSSPWLVACLQFTIPISAGLSVLEGSAPALCCPGSWEPL